MRITRLRLTNFKDILLREVQFPPSGVIVIQGPNEIGKTALQEAIDLILDLPADSRHRRVAAQRPAARDLSPEVELEADCGPYSFTYSKRFRHPPARDLASHTAAPARAADRAGRARPGQGHP